MRTVVCGILAAVLTFAQSPPAGQPAAGMLVLTGRVTTGSGPDLRPVRRARVTLTGRGLIGSRVRDTDAAGGYRFDRLVAGDYRAQIQKPGFVKYEGAATPGATLTLVRGAAVEGIVTDSAGDPLQNIVVTALQPPPGGGPPAAAARSRTDDLGRYRLHSLAEGDYYVEAATDPAVIAGQILMPRERRPEVSRVYYPAAQTLDEAKPLHVSAARDMAGIDLTLTPNAPTIDPAAPPPPPRPEPAGTARIAGRLVDAVSRKPVKGARLLLVPLEGVALTNWKRSDAQGRFEYTALAARRYRLSVTADRFVSLDYGQQRPGETGTPIQVRDGEDFRADMALPRAGALEGTLLDEFGDPAPGLMVQIAGRRFVAGRHRLMPMEGRAQSAVTDDQGHYRVSGLNPGDYYVAALSGAYTDQNETGGFAPTYYPGTTDAGAAAAIAIPFGADAPGASFTLVPAPTVAVSGTMVDGAGQPVSRGTLWLAPPDRLQRMDFNLARGSTAPDGSFTLRNVPAGMYTLQGFGVPPAGGRGPFNLGAMPFGWAPLAIGDADLDHVVLTVTNGTMLRGRIVLNDSALAPPPKADEVRVTAIPSEFDSAPVGGGPPPSRTLEDWTFEVTNMSGLRRIFVSVASPAWALEKITLNEKDVTDTPVDFRTRNVENVEVVLTPKVSAVLGGVSDDKGPVTDYAVVIFSSDPTRWIDRSRFVVMGRPTQLGRFEVRGLPPEAYLAVALPNVVGTEWMDPEFLQRLRPYATDFVLTEGERRTLELKLKKPPSH